MIDYIVGLFHRFLSSDNKDLKLKEELNRELQRRGLDLRTRYVPDPGFIRIIQRQINDSFASMDAKLKEETRCDLTLRYWYTNINHYSYNKTDSTKSLDEITDEEIMALHYCPYIYQYIFRLVNCYSIETTKYSGGRANSFEINVDSTYDLNSFCDLHIHSAVHRHFLCFRCTLSELLDNIDKIAEQIHKKYREDYSEIFTVVDLGFGRSLKYDMSIPGWV
jgi:hypothetical protein